MLFQKRVNCTDMFSIYVGLATKLTSGAFFWKHIPELDKMHVGSITQHFPKFQKILVYSDQVPQSKIQEFHTIHHENMPQTKDTFQKSATSWSITFFTDIFFQMHSKFKDTLHIYTQPFHI